MSSSQSKPPLPWALIIVFVITSPVLLLAGFKYTVGLKEKMINSRKDELEAVAGLQVDQIVQWKHEKEVDAIVIGENIPIINQVNRCIYEMKGESDASAIRSWMGSFIKNMDYLNASITDSLGHVKFSFPENDTVIGPLMKPLIPIALKDRKVILTDLHRAARGQIVHLDLIIPLLMEKAGDKTLVGLMVLRIDPRKILYPLISKWSAKSRTSETLLVRREGDSVLYLNDVKHLPSRALEMTRPMNNERLVGALAVMGFEGVTEGVDYRGVDVLASVRKIPDSNWYMISKVDMSEVKVQVSGALILIRLLIIFFLTAFGAITGWTIWHLRVKFYRDRYDAKMERDALESHFKYILKYANDIILLLNSDMKIVEANDRAASTYQYSGDELIGMSILDLRMPELKSEFDENMRRLNESGMSTYETVHRKKDGTTFPLEISARVFEIEGKKYYQSIGRDISERKSVEAMINQLIDRYNTAIHAALLAVWDYDLVNDHLIWDDMVYELYGVRKEDFPPVYSSWLKMIHPDDRDSADSMIKSSIAARRDYSTEFRIIRPDESVRYIKSFGHVTSGKDGSPTRIIGINYDITDQKNAENLLKEREFWLSQSQKVGKIGSYIFNIKSMSWSSSEVLDEIFGIGKDYVRTLEGWNKIVHPDDKDLMLKYVVEDVIGKGIFFDREYRILNQMTGNTQWLYGRGELTFGSDGKPLLMIGTIQDITRRKTAEIELENSFWLLKATIESTADGLLVVDSSGKIVAYNRKFADMWSIPSEIMELKDDEKALKFVVGQLKDPDKFTGTVQDLYTSPEKISYDSIEFKDGKVFERYSQPQRINDKIVGRVWSFRDITQKKNAENQLIRAKELAEESDKLKTAFLHNISHEIRTPMNAIVGFSALLEDPLIDDETRRHYTGIITQSTNQLLALISDIVEVSNIEAGQVKLTFSEVNVNSLIRELFSQFSINAKNQDLEFISEASMPDERALINTDKTKLTQILTNLLSNAFKFTRKGAITFGYRIVENDLVFFVRDTGIGIPKEKFEKIFERFFQVESDISREFAGAGLGLSICKAYAELLGGKILITSTVGEGSEFCFRHPL